MHILAIPRLLRDAGRAWYKDRTFEMGAALAFYSAFAASPILLFTILITSVFFGSGIEQAQLAGRLNDIVSPSVAQAMVQTIRQSRQAAMDWSSLLVGTCVLLIGAVGLFSQLQDSLNSVWKVKPDPKRSWWTMVRQRAPVLLMVVGVIVVLVLALLGNTVLWLAATPSLPWPAGRALWTALHWLLSLVVLAILIALVYKVLPETEIHWGDVWVGALVTAVLFTAGNYLVGTYLSRLQLTSSYGASGSWLVLLLWAFYASQAFLFGAAFTRIYADERGKSIRPAKGAVSAPQAGRA